MMPSIVHSSRFAVIVILVYVGSAAATHVPHWSPEGRIINGQVASPHSVPHAVYIQITTDEGVGICGGSLISVNHILTAGHCLDEIDKFEAYFGVHNISDASEPNRQVRKKGKRIVHKKFNKPPYHNDIGVIKLADPVTLNEHVQLAKLVTRADAAKTYVNETATVYGWGRMKEDDEDSDSEVLRYVQAPVISSADCYAEDKRTYDGNLCTSGKGNIGACFGDSGGPLMLDGAQIGIVSHGATFKCEQGDASVYVKIGQYLDWIEDAMKQ